MNEKKDLIKHVNTIEYRGRSERHKQGYLKTDLTLNKYGSSKRWVTVGDMASVNSFFMSMCDKLSRGEIIDLSMDITKILYGLYPNVDAIKAMAKRYGYDKEVVEMNKQNGK